MSTDSWGVPETLQPAHRPVLTLVILCVCVYVHSQACVSAFCVNFRMHNLMRRQAKLPPGTICQVFRWGNINTRICSHIFSFRLPAEEEWRHFCQPLRGSDKYALCVCWSDSALWCVSVLSLHRWCLQNVCTFLQSWEWGTRRGQIHCMFMQKRVCACPPQSPDCRISFVTSCVTHWSLGSLWRPCDTTTHVPMKQTWEGLLEGKADLTSLDSVGTVTCRQIYTHYISFSALLPSAWSQWKWPKVI